MLTGLVKFKAPGKALVKVTVCLSGQEDHDKVIFKLKILISKPILSSHVFVVPGIIYWNTRILSTLNPSTRTLVSSLKMSKNHDLWHPPCKRLEGKVEVSSIHRKLLQIIPREFNLLGH